MKVSGMCLYRRHQLLHSQIKTGRIKKRLQSGAGRQATGRRHSLLRPVDATELMTCFSTDIWGAGSRAKREKLDWRREILKVIMRWCNGGGGIWGRGHNWEHGTIPGNSADARGGLWASSTHTTVTCQKIGCFTWEPCFEQKFITFSFFLFHSFLLLVVLSIKCFHLNKLLPSLV